MATISFKSDGEFKNTLEVLARKKGINTSAYIKLILTEGVDEELSRLTKNGLTIAEELAILSSDENEKNSRSYSSTKSLMKALKK